jgi:hypothetical protein
MLGRSSSAHRTLDLPSQWVDWCLSVVPCRGLSVVPWCGAVVRLRVRLEQPAYAAGVERSNVSQRPGQRPPTLGEGEAAGVGMQVCTATRQPSPPVGNRDAVDRNDPKEVGLHRPPPAAHARAHRDGEMSDC